MSQAKYGSDLMAEALQGLGLEYIAFNPGTSYRALHESLVNHLGEGGPKLLLCTHESVAVSIAHGYSRVTSKPMAVIVHDTVGLLNASLGVYNAWMDQAPVLVFSGNGPMAMEKRRPWLDWIHTSLVPGTIVREYVKFDDQPGSAASVPESIIRAYRVAMTEPRGPVYVCLDSGLQEEELDGEVPAMPVSNYVPPSRPQADPEAVRQAAELLAEAKTPVIIAEYMGRDPAAVPCLIELAELLSAPVIDFGGSFNFPSNHPLDLTGAQNDLLREADVVLSLDVPHLFRRLTTTEKSDRDYSYLISNKTKVIEITLQDYRVKSWAQGYGKLVPVALPIAASSSLALPAITACCRELLKGKAPASLGRLAGFERRKQVLRQKVTKDRESEWEKKPVSWMRLFAELGDLVKNDDWSLVSKDPSGLARRLWSFDKPYRFPGGQKDIGCGLGFAIGAALANSVHGRLSINLQTDGDFLFTPSGLWTAARYHIPFLTVMLNNRAYVGIENQVHAVARERGRSLEAAKVGSQFTTPSMDYAGLARSFGMYGEGPVSDPKDLRGALERAIAVVKSNKPALVDVVVQPR
ncbi:MAG: thiamine pyrophosphate-binding protein [Chloroflexi bacterium]|nr:thiamine pyrophosphate-binding protein [Chloroflexota bacterium]